MTSLVEKKAFIRDNVRGMVSSLKRKKPKKHVNLERDCQSQTFGGLWKGKTSLKIHFLPHSALLMFRLLHLTLTAYSKGQ